MEMLLMLICMLLKLSVALKQNNISFDAYTGKILNQQEIKKLELKNITSWCVRTISLPCDPNEWRRPDDSCNNIHIHNQNAMPMTTHYLIPTEFDNNNGTYNKRRSHSGNQLNLARVVRWNILSDGWHSSQHFTHLLTHFLVFFAFDFSSIRDSLNYVMKDINCCSRGHVDEDCTTSKVPEDDPVHRFSDIRCLNQTKPDTYQKFGCAKNDTKPERISIATPSIDMSILYGHSAASFAKGRLFKGGLLRYDILNGRDWPPNAENPHAYCKQNSGPNESRCHDTPEKVVNTVLGINLCTIWFWRQHNTIARALYKLNPCWEDEQLFQTARDINIAIYSQIIFYEVLPALYGRQNLIRAGVIQLSEGFRDIYDESFMPYMNADFSYALRWFHTMQEGRLKMYDLKGNYLRMMSIANLTLRTGFLADNLNLAYITQGAFRQPTAKADFIVDPDLGERAFGGMQQASDLFTNDIDKGRWLGIAPYFKYVQFCFSITIVSFDDLAFIMDEEKLDSLKESYESVLDVELMAGISSERLVFEGHVPPTLFCITVEQLRRGITSDRHWYERSKRPHAFTTEQLKEIRKTTIAQILCENGDHVTEIQERAFERISQSNRLRSCQNVAKLNLSHWKDTCKFRKFNQ